MTFHAFRRASRQPVWAQLNFAETWHVTVWAKAGLESVSTTTGRKARTTACIAVELRGVCCFDMYRLARAFQIYLGGAAPLVGRPRFAA